jgi:hypothetical protein
MAPSPKGYTPLWVSMGDGVRGLAADQVQERVCGRAHEQVPPVRRPCRCLCAVCGPAHLERRDTRHCHWNAQDGSDVRMSLHPPAHPDVPRGWTTSTATSSMHGASTSTASSAGASAPSPAGRATKHGPSNGAVAAARIAAIFMAATTLRRAAPRRCDDQVL